MRDGRRSRGGGERRPTTRDRGSTRQRRRVLDRQPDWPLIGLDSAGRHVTDRSDAQSAIWARSEGARARKGLMPDRGDIAGSRPASVQGYDWGS